MTILRMILQLPPITVILILCLMASKSLVWEVASDSRSEVIEVDDETTTTTKFSKLPLPLCQLCASRMSGYFADSSKTRKPDSLPRRPFLVVPGGKLVGYGGMTIGFITRRTKQYVVIVKIISTNKAPGHVSAVEMRCVCLIDGRKGLSRSSKT